MLLPSQALAEMAVKQRVHSKIAFLAAIMLLGGFQLAGQKTVDLQHSK